MSLGLRLILAILLCIVGQHRSLAADGRLDELRPDEGAELTLFGKPLTINSEYEAVLRYRKDFALAEEDDDLVRLDQDLALKFFYPWRETIALYAETSAVAEIDLYAEDGDEKTETSLELDEAWIYFDRLLDGGAGLQIGRQNIAETREWWWDAEFDALRGEYQHESWRVELAIARQLFKVSTADEFIEPEEDGLMRVLARASVDWGEDQVLEAFFLSQDDRSDAPQLGEIVDPERADEFDEKLWWLGLRALGKQRLENYGKLSYWLDTAIVRGDETVLEFDDEDGQNQVVAREDSKVRGWGFDLGLSWITLLPGEPTFTLAYAQGSGDADLNDRSDRAFRQTGLADNNGRFHGVNRFRYYGELLQPELSNLGIVTLAVGLPLLQNSSVEMVYHTYRQLEPAPFLRDSRINIDPGGNDKDIGQEFDIIFGFEEWDDLELELIGSVFEAGDAYEEQSGKHAYRFFFQFNYSF